MQKRFLLAGIVCLLVVFLIAFLYWNSSAMQNNSNVLKTDKKPIRLGVLVPLTGNFAHFGNDVLIGLETAGEEIEKESGLSFGFVVEDSAADPKIALPAAGRLIEVDAVSIIIGGPGSSANLSVAPLMEKNKVIFVAISSSPKLNDAGEYVFKIQPDIDVEAIRMAEFAFKKGYKRIGIIFDAASDTHTTGKNVFVKTFKELGGEIVGVEAYDSKTVADLRTQLAKIKAEKPDALYFLAIGKIAGLAAKQAKEIGLSAQIFGWSAFSEREFLDSAGAGSEGIIITDFRFSCESALTKSFCDDYAKKSGGKIPLKYGAHAFDALKLLAQLIHRNGNVFDKALLLKEMREIRSYKGVSGNWFFDENGNIRDEDFVFRVVRNGEFEVYNE